MSADLESEQFMTLLTDALRAGPGSPQWHEAVGALRSGQAGADADDYRMLIQAREDLESGKGYRSVRAGMGFTRKLMAEIEAGGTGRKGLPTANLVALLAGGVILAVVIVVAVVLFKSAGNDDRARQVDQLRNLVFVNGVSQVTFEGGKDVPTEWKLVGEVPLKTGKREGLAPAATQPVAGDKREYRSGAVVRAESMPPGQAFLMEATLRVGRLSDGIIPQVFVSEGPLDEVKATGAKELVCLLRGGTLQVVLADLSVPSQGEKLDAKKLPLTIPIKVRMNKDTVIVESGDQKLYEGPHKLSETAGRYVGIRFSRKVGDGVEGIGAESISVLKP